MSDKPDFVDAEFEENIGEIALSETRPVGRTGDFISQYLANEADYDTPPAEAAHAAIIAEVMSKDTAEGVLAETEPIPLDQLVGHILTVHSFTMNESDYDQGPPIYATVRAHDETDEEPVLINIGHQRVMAQLMRLRDLDALPVRAQVKQASRPNRFGKYPLSFVAVRPKPKK